MTSSSSPSSSENPDTTPDSSAPIPDSPAGETSFAMPSSLKWAIGIAFFGQFAQMSINPLLAPLARELHMHEWQLGLVMSTSALIVAVTSRFWGRVSQEHGPKRILSIGTTSGFMALMAFAITAQLGSNFYFSVTTVFLLLVFTRGLWFGGSLAIINPSVQTHVALSTRTEKARVKGMATLGAAQGLAMIAGSAAAGFLGGVNILLVTWLVPLTMLTGMLMAFFGMPHDKPHCCDEPDDNEIVDVGASSSPVSATLIHPESFEPPQPKTAKKISVWDKRIFPYVLMIFILYTGFGFVQVLMGFMIQDRYHLDVHTVASYTGSLMLGSGVCMLLAQGVLVPRLGLAPRWYIRIGTVLATCALILLFNPLPFTFAIIAMMMMGLGLGFSLPGINAGASLAVSPEEQGGTSGSISASMALTFVFTPVISTTLYMYAPQLPMALGILFCMVAVGLAFFSPGLRVDTSKSV